ncbi:hypothetical protein [Pseudomonas sp. HS6]|uniref:hypothetical protein n=1 Tax=Pseudomonas sp. HS6 TaxID=2850559 RepID=UPI002019EB3C|nr:hypothetical protein [Pseudomonas sp. HS6]UQS13934.1 hypothetical protein JJN09_22300 [Pseudomonas sp. HS6]
MNNSTLWLEVDKTNQAILSYYLEQPTTASDKFDYAQVTQDELTYLSALEDAVFPAGMVATTDDLYTHRTRVQAAQKAKPTVPVKASPAAPQQPAKATKAATITNFRNGFKPVRNKPKETKHD